MDIVTLTLNPSVDTSTTVDRVMDEEKLRCASPLREAGGGGINVARAVQQLGGAATAMYTAGGIFGQMLQRLLDQTPVAHEPIEVEEETRENVVVLETTTDRQYRFTMPGPNLREREWRMCLDRITALDPAPGYLVVSGSAPPGLPMRFFELLAGALAGRHTRLVMDTSGAALREAVKEGVYLLKPNLREMRDLTGRALEQEAEQDEAARELVARGACELVVLSLGAAGALAVSADGCRRFRAPTVPIRSRVGAGDSMTAGIVLHLSRGKSFEEAVRFGIAAGSAAAMTPGTELCRREDAERLYAQMQAAREA